MRKRSLIIPTSLVFLLGILLLSPAVALASPTADHAANMGFSFAPNEPISNFDLAVAANAPRTTPRARQLNSSSINWSGYAAETNLSSPQRNSVSDVKGSWVVPSVSSSASNAYSSAWLGMDGYSNNTVEQIGTDSDWVNGQPVYYAWYEMYPRFPVTISSLTVNPGNSISAEVQYIGTNQFRLTITNSSTGQSFSTVQKIRAKRQSAEWIQEAPSSGGTLPLANFGTINFSSCFTTINGHTGSINDYPNTPANWQYDAITMVTTGGVPKATPSGLSTDGTSFSVTWNHN